MKTLLEIAPLASKDTIALNPHLNPVQGNVKRFRGILKGIIEGNPPHEANHQRQIPNTEQCEQAPALGSEGKGEAPRPKRPLVGFTLYRVKLLDWEAKYSSVKDLLDGLQIAGLIHGDREDQIDPKSYVRQEKVKSYKDERTVIEVTL